MKRAEYRIRMYDWRADWRTDTVSGVVFDYPVGERVSKFGAHIRNSVVHVTDLRSGIRVCYANVHPGTKSVGKVSLQTATKALRGTIEREGVTGFQKALDRAEPLPEQQV